VRSDYKFEITLLIGAEFYWNLNISVEGLKEDEKVKTMKTLK